MAQTYLTWGGLNDRPFRLLAYMALVSLDRDDPPRFWGGREDLASAIGRRVPREPDDIDQSHAAKAIRRQRHAAFEAVRAGIAELKAVGAITVAKQARTGTRAEYLLNLAQAQPVAKAQAEPGAQAQGSPVVATGSPCFEPQAHPGPKEKVGGLGKLRGEERLGLSPYVAATARAAS